MAEPERFFDSKVMLYSGDCLEALPTFAADTFDSCVCDPPYHLASIVKRFGKDGSAPAKSDGATGVYKRASAGFMGKRWDGGDIAFRPETWAQVLRVLKPGAHLAAFAAPKNAHRLTCAIEDAGFEIRDVALWLHGQGFPKSHDVAKAILKAAGTVCVHAHDRCDGGECPYCEPPEAAVEAANKWHGWGTALKPAHEPIVIAMKPIIIARKPLDGTVAENVLAHGVGGINIDGCRVGATKNVPASPSRLANGNALSGSVDGSLRRGTGNEDGFNPNIGRWPANIAHDGSAEVVELFPDTSPSSARARHNNEHKSPARGRERQHTTYGHDDSGSAARFFYCAKATADDRIGSKHPTVKPIALLRWLARLVTPPGGLILDPFAGTGTVSEAGMYEGMRSVAIELEADSQADFRRRMALVMAGPEERARAIIKARGLVEPFEQTDLGKAA